MLGWALPRIDRKPLMPAMQTRMITAAINSAVFTRSLIGSALQAASGSGANPPVSPQRLLQPSSVAIEEEAVVAIGMPCGQDHRDARSAPVAAGDVVELLPGEHLIRGRVGAGAAGYLLPIRIADV